MVTATVFKSELAPADIKFFEKSNPNYNLTENSIQVEFYENGKFVGSETMPIFKSKRGSNFTPYGMARQTGDKIVCARHDRYYKFDLDGSLISLDANDDSSEI